MRPAVRWRCEDAPRSRIGGRVGQTLNPPPDAGLVGRLEWQGGKGGGMLSQLVWTDALIPIGTFLGIAGGAVVAWYIAIRKNNQTLAEQRAKLTKEDRELTIKEKAAASKLKAEENRTVAKEYIDLFEAAKREWNFANERHKDCEKRIIMQEKKIVRMEVALERAGITIDGDGEDNKPETTPESKP